MPSVCYNERMKKEEIEKNMEKQPWEGDLARPLLQWYGRHKRVLPWREDPSPYHVWLSEIMLQQTRVEAVKGYYRRFLEVLPDIAALAGAKEEEYLKLWEGLGYYSRVQNLHKAAVMIMEEYGGQMPAEAKELSRLPGVGDYTCAAIASIAFGHRIPAVDGNFLRIFARLTAFGESIKTGSGKKAAFDFFQRAMEALPKKSRLCGDFNQALMDLGAMVCLPAGRPLCTECPLAEFCQARALDQTENFPKKEEKKPRKKQERTVFIIKAGSRIALGKRPKKGLLAGLYEFPNTLGYLSKEEGLDFVKSHGLLPLGIQPLKGGRHIFTHMEWHMKGYAVEVLPPLEEEKEWEFVQEEAVFLEKAIPSAFGVFLKALGQRKGPAPL